MVSCKLLIWKDSCWAMSARWLSVVWAASVWLVVCSLCVAVVVLMPARCAVAIRSLRVVRSALMMAGIWWATCHAWARIGV